MSGNDRLTTQHDERAITRAPTGAPAQLEARRAAACPRLSAGVGERWGIPPNLRRPAALARLMDTGDTVRVVPERLQVTKDVAAV